MSRHWLEPDWEPGLTIPHLPLQHFLDMEMQALVLDVDRTLLSGREVVLQKSVTDWVNEARHHLTLHLLSNNPSRRRIGTVAKQLDLTFTCGAAKPRRAALKKVLEGLQLNPANIAMVGDRLFTDILVGNRLGLYTVLVRPLSADGNASSQNKFQKLEQKLAEVLGAHQR